MLRRQDEHSPEEPTTLPRGVRRALAAMRAAPGRDLDLAEIAAVAGTPVRTLQRQFRTFLGKSPLDALRDIRFEAARRDLLLGAPGATVGDIALGCGLTHLARFSAEYRRRYGENPSRTLERQRREPAAQARRPPAPAFVHPHDRASLAVLPPEARGGDKEIAAGIAAAIAAALARAGVAVTQNAQAARYRLLSSFRGDGHRARLAYRLIDAETGRVVWAHHHDGAAEDAFLYEDRVAAGVAAAVQPGLRAAEIARARAKRETDLTAYDLTLKALPHAAALEADEAGRALDLLDRALARDPGNALALALAAWCHAQHVVFQFRRDPAEERARALDLGARALRLGGDATVMAVLGHAFTSAHELGMADHVVRQALALDGASAWAWARSGWIDVYSGRAEPAIERFAIAADLAPHDPLAFNGYVGLGCAHFHAGRYAEAIHWLERAVAARPSATWTERVLCPAYLFAGRRPDAEQSLGALRQAYPGFTIAEVTAAIPLPQDFRDRLADGLDSLGVPAGP